jgi:orotidine-5'-phosphate decarboxylase
MRNFMEMIKDGWDEGKFVCIGLDSEYAKIPDCVKEESSSIPRAIFAFNREIVEATKHLVCAYKPNSAFYEAYGEGGISALQQTIAYIKDHVPSIPVILDAKRADIGNTNKGYVDGAFRFMKADAITVHPYLGGEALEPFLSQKDKGIIVLCRTSNPNAGEFQDLVVNGEPLYRFVARRVSTVWNKNGNCAVVVGATYSDELLEVRRIVGDMPILIPGIGAQGGDVEKTVAAGKDSQSKGMIINSSRAIIFASNGKDFAQVAREKTRELNELINLYI